MRKLLLGTLMLCLPVAAQAITITISGQSFFAGAYQYGGSSASIRIYATKSFIASDGTAVPAGAVGTSAFFKTVSCTVASNTLTCPSFTLPSTSDAIDDQTARYTFVLYDSAGRKRDTLYANIKGGQLYIPANLGSTLSFSQIALANQTTVPRIDTSTYTKTEINTLIGLSDVTSVFGRKGAVVAATNDYTFAQIGSKPTTIVGYGITDSLVNTFNGRSGTVTPATNDYTWAQIDKTTSSIADIATRSAGDLNSGTLPDGRFPATLPAASGVNLTALNATQLTSGTVPDARFPSTLPAISGTNLTNLNASNLASGTVPDARFPATLPALSGANLTNLDASDLASGTIPDARMPNLTGDVTTSEGAVATTIANDAVTYAKMQNVSAASKLLGRGDSGSGDVQEITLGTGLSMSGTTLSTSGISGTGTLNVLPKVTNATGPVYGDSSVTDDGTNVSSTKPIQVLQSATNFLRFTRDSSGNSKWLQTLLKPTAPSAALVVDATGNCTAGAHLFKVTYVTAAGETEASNASGSVTCDAANTKVTITIPNASTATGWNTIATGRNIYATAAGGSTYFLVAASPVVANNTDGTYTFNIADGSFLATQAPTVNTAIDARITIDNLGNVGIGGANPQFVDDGQGKSFTVDGGSVAGYIGVGATSVTNVTSIVGGLAFFNLAMGGVDHRVGWIKGINNGALGQGALVFGTSPTSVGPVDRMLIAYDGTIRMGNINVAGGTLAVTALDAGSTHVQQWFDWTGTPVGSFTNGGNLVVGNVQYPGGGGTPVFVLQEASSNPSSIALNSAGLVAKDVAGTSALFAFDDAGNVRQIVYNAFTTPTFTTSIVVPAVVGGTATTSPLTLQTTSGVGTTGSDIIFKDDNTELVRILNNGNVGISTAGPNAPLEIGGIGAADSSYIYLSDPTNVAHGLTTLHPTSVFGALIKNGLSGGLIVRGLSEVGSVQALKLDGMIGDTTTTVSAVQIRGFKKTGTTITALAAGENVFQVLNNATNLLIMTGDGASTFTSTVNAAGFGTATNCSDSAGDAACGSAAAGSIVVDAGDTTTVVSTTRVTANSQIILTFDSSLGTRLGVTCNTTAVQPTVSARTAATSFTLTVGTAPVTNPACFSYQIIN